MNNKKAKIIIAILIFIFLGLIIFAFASPNDENGENLDNRVKQGEVDKKPSKDTEKESKDEKNGKENENTTPTEKKEETIDDSFDKAKAAVEAAEKSLTKEDVETAKKAIEAVSEGFDTKELEDRIAAVESDINARDLVDALAKLVEEAENREDIKEAIAFDNEKQVEAAVEAVNNEELKAELEETLEDILKVLNDATAPKVNVEAKATTEDVTIDVKDDTEVTITLNGKEVENGTVVTEEGKYTLVATDEAFNETEVKFVIDKTAPKVSSVDPDSYVSEDVTISIEDTTEVTIALTKDGEEVEFTETLTKDGSYYLVVTDEVGHETEVYFVIDQTNPSIEGVKDNAIVSTDVTLTITDTNLSEITVNEETVTLNEQNQIVFEEDGEYEVVVTDMAGNSTTINFIIDKTFNNVTVVQNPNSKTITNGSVVVTITADEEVTITSTSAYTTTDNKVFTYTYKNNATEEITLTDRAGNEQNITVTVSNIDKVKPVVEFSGNSPREVSNNPIEVNITEENLANVYFETYKLSLLELGNIQELINKIRFTHDVTANVEETEDGYKYVVDTENKNGIFIYAVKVVDKAGNEKVEIATAILDTIAPTVVSESYIDLSTDEEYDGSLTNHPIKVTIVFDDEVTLPEEWTYGQKSTLFVRDDKTVAHRIFEDKFVGDVEFTDNAGNITTIHIDLSNLDRVAPEITINGLPESTETISNQSISATVADEHLGENPIVKYYISETKVEDIVKEVAEENLKTAVHNEETENFDLDTANLDETYYIYVIASDEAGNIKVVSADGIKLDMVNPTITDVEDFVNTNVTLKITDTNLDSVTVNDEVVTLDDNNQITLEEEKAYTVVATDKAGNTTTKTFTIDKTDPSITGVDDNAFVNTKVELTITDTNLDKVTVNNVEVTLDDNNQITLEDENAYTVVATDKVGHTTTKTFTIDQTAPKFDAKDASKDKTGIKNILDTNYTFTFKVTEENLDTVKYAKASATTIQFLLGIDAKQFYEKAESNVIPVDITDSGNYTIHEEMKSNNIIVIEVADKAGNVAYEYITIAS